MSKTNTIETLRKICAEQVNALVDEGYDLTDITKCVDLAAREMKRVAKQEKHRADVLRLFESVAEEFGDEEFTRKDFDALAEFINVPKAWLTDVDFIERSRIEEFYLTIFDEYELEKEISRQHGDVCPDDKVWHVVKSEFDSIDPDIIHCVVRFGYSWQKDKRTVKVDVIVDTDFLDNCVDDVHTKRYWYRLKK